MKSAEEIMQILDAYDLTGSLRDAGELADCSHHTVARYVAAREQGRLTAEAVRRAMLIDAFLPKLEEWVQRSGGQLRADIAHRKLVDLGFQGSARTTRRAVAEVRANWRAGRTRVHRPWLPEPGMWVQYDFGDGPPVAGVPTQLFCAWLAWSRFRVVLPILDKTLPTVIAAVDTALRRVGGVPTYLLTDNEKTVTVEHVAGIPVRHPEMRRGGPALRAERAHLPGRRRPDQGRVGGHGAHRQGRPGAHRGEPARRLRQLRRAGGRVRGVLRGGQRPPAPDHPAAAGGHAGRGTGPAAPAAGPSLHGGVRGDPRGAGQHPDGLVRDRAATRCRTAGRAERVGAPARRAGRRRPCRPRGPGRGRPAPAHRPGQPPRRRRALPAPAGDPAAPHAAGPHRGGDGVPGPRRRGGAVADRGRRPPAPAGSGPRWPRRSPWPSWWAPHRSAGRSGTPRSPAASPTATWPRSWPTRPAAGPGPPTPPGRTARCPRAPAAGPTWAPPEDPQ